MNNSWQIWIDTGGTFTDCIGIDAHGKTHRTKILSNSSIRGTVQEVLSPTSFKTDASWLKLNIYDGFHLNFLEKPHDSAKISSVKEGVIHIDKSLSGLIKGKSFEITSHEEAPVLASRMLTRTSLKQKFPPIDIKIGSTRGTNALLERKGAKTALLITHGFGDLLDIGTQQRPDIFKLAIQKPSTLLTKVIEIKERLNKDGNVLQVLNIEGLEKIILEFKKEQIGSVAVAFMHSYKNPQHEIAIKKFLSEHGFQYISLSSELFPGIKFLERAQTATVNAYLSPIIEQYIRGIKPHFNTNSLRIMSSAGGLSLADQYNAKDSLYSGPAGGVIGAVNKARMSGLYKVITFDMGGTSSDVAIYNKEFDYTFETEIDHIKISSPSLSISTVAAGGGSICKYDGLKYSVGPDSSGASPGPSCYGQDGPLSITDINLLLGYIDPSNFEIPLDFQSAISSFEELIPNNSPENNYQILQGFREIANQKMAEAIRKISIEKGNDPADYTLVAFGGAGAQHVCSVADQLGMSKILIPSDAGILSAYGIGNARIERFTSHQILEKYSSFLPNLHNFIQTKSEETLKLLILEGFEREQVETRRVLCYLRFYGQDHSIELDYDHEHLLQHFEDKYKALYGHWPENHSIEIESIKILASTLESVPKYNSETSQSYTPKPDKYISGQYHKKKIPVYDESQLQVGARIEGEALLLSDHSTTLIEEGWSMQLEENGNLLLTRVHNHKDTEYKRPEQLELELFTNRFRSIAEDMGALLQRTSFSVNIKERLDFSCALMDPNGDLIVNAPHIPVHLGGMGICVKSIASSLKLEEGDVVITNHPGYGGSHLPDITLIAPVYFENQLVGYVANRAHHAELGGEKPGSMPPDAKNLLEEGVVISPTFLVKKHKTFWKEIEEILITGPYPSRSPEENIADLNAALASIRFGIERLSNLCRKYGTNQVLYYMDSLKEYSASSLEKTIKPFLNQKLYATESLDDGSIISVKIEILPKAISIDFNGTSGVHQANYNATPAIVHSAVIYVLRLLVAEDIPLNEGLMKHVKILLPTCFLNPHFPEDPALCPPVVAGNTETSQRVVDTLLKALEISACSQGTMNNFLFGNEHFGYYETIGGGTGASHSNHGVDAVHQHMTNTRITDPEILEFRYPVHLEEFSIRKNSGGAGKWHGGNGIVRKFRFLVPLEITVLAQHRIEKPYGMKGGMQGSPGRQYIQNNQGILQKIEGSQAINVEAGDRLILETPGGGGFGK